MQYTSLMEGAEPLSVEAELDRTMQHVLQDLYGSPHLEDPEVGGLMK